MRIPWRPLRQQFALEQVDQEGVIYLDGNSLGVLPRAPPIASVRWSSRSGAPADPRWNRAGWITLSHNIADKIARLIGAGAGEVIVADRPQYNLYKVLSAAIATAKKTGRRRIVRSAPTFLRSLHRRHAARRKASSSCSSIARRSQPRSTTGSRS